MNGDLSLSQSLGGLRIANPDDDDSNDATTTSTSSRLQPIHAAQQPNSFAPAPPRNPSALPPLHPQVQTNMTQQPPNEPSPVSAGGLDVNSLGFDPSNYAAERQAFPTPKYAAPPPDEPSHTLNHRQSIPLAQEAQKQPHYAQPRTYNPPSIRPMSGVYHNAGPSTGPVSLPESTYQRVRAESTQSAAAAVTSVPRRTDSKSGLGDVPSSRIPNGRANRQHSNSNPPIGSQYPPRRSSKTTPSSQDTAPPPPGALTRQPLPTDTAPTTGGVETGKDKGPAPTVTRKPIESEGKPPSKVIKKGVKDFNFGRTLGEGSYSTVLAATDRATLKEYAIKVLDKRHIIKEKKVKYVNIERDTLNRLTDHPGIVRLYYTFQDERSLYFVLDLATGGELLGVLKKMSTFDEECSRFYAAQILDSVEYMHLRGIIHRDLKPENVLLDDQMHVKITDFGTAKILDLSGNAQFGRVSVINDPLDGADTDRAVSFVGTAEYVSPELLTDKNACKASDLWAFGCIVYQLLAGRPPFKAGNEYQTFQKIVHLDYSFPDGFPPVARDLVTKLLVLDPAKRLPTEAIKNHPFFDGIQWGEGLWRQKAPKLRSYNPLAAADTRSRDPMTDALPAPFNSQQTKGKNSQSALGQSSSVTPPRPQPRIITELAPPSQLDIDWSPVLTKANERIVKLGQLVVYSAPAPHSPTSRSGSTGETPAEVPSKFSRLFGSSVTKKRQRLVMITSGARLVLAPAGGERKEAKQIVNLTDPDVSWKTQQDAKGYTVWCVFTKERHLTFEDPKANTGDSGSSMRSTQEWLDSIEEVKSYGPVRRRTDPFPEDSVNGINPSLNDQGSRTDIDESLRPDPASIPSSHRKMLRKEPGLEDDSAKARKRFSKRHSKNGLAAVF